MEKFLNSIGPLFRSKKNPFENIFKGLYPNIIINVKTKLLNLCGIIMEEFYLNTCLLKILEMEIYKKTYDIKMSKNF